MNRSHNSNLTRAVLGAVLTLIICASSASAQSATEAAKPNVNSVQTFYLTNVNEVTEANEVVVALRNMLDPSDKVFLVPSQNAIFVSASPDQLLVAQKLLKDLDHPRKTYRLIYTITETEEDKRVGSQNFAITVVSGARTTIKNGSKIPVATGSYSSGASGTQTQFTYLDIGLNIDASLAESVNGVRLRTKVERSSVTEDKSISGVNEPIVRQMVLEGTSILTPHKQVMLGSLDVPGSTRHLELGVTLELVP
jgi:type II secretory pathway component GspD/PulD (secretin)